MNPITAFFDHADKVPNRPALISVDFDMDYATVADLVKRIASRLFSEGIQKENVVGLRLRPELEAMFTIALMQIGATSLHASDLVKKAYGAHIDFLITGNQFVPDDQIKKILIDEDFISSLVATKRLETVTELSDEAICRIVFSSGTTGTPKGIPYSSKFLLERVESAESNWVHPTPFMSLLGQDTVVGFVGMMWALLRGQTFFISANPSQDLQLISQHNIASIKTSPAKLNELLELQEQNPKNLDNLTSIVVAGSLLTTKTIHKTIKLTSVTPVYLYGSTEVGAVTNGVADLVQTSNVGKIVTDIEVEAIADDRTPVPHGTEGTLRFRKKFMPDDYWKLKSHKLGIGFINGWFYPGDIGIITEDNELIIHGRTDDLVNAGGTKFTLQQLDAWLQDSEKFLDAGTATYFDKEGNTKIAVAVVAKNVLSHDVILNELESFLPNMPIGSVLIVKEIKRNQLGKIDQKYILDRLTTSLGEK